VLIGPGGAGKGTVAKALTEGDERLWLSRSWTTRPRREGEAADAYVFTDPESFDAHVAAGGFLEWAEFLGHRYGTPVPTPPAGADVLLEIDIQGARQVLALDPDATVILVMPPSLEAQERRLVARGDDAEHVTRRLQVGEDEAREGRKLAGHEVVNDDLDRVVGELAGIVEGVRSARR
jgi:guanylate kinase